ncbi:MAG TPA: SDR family NAD(P)-dependent oxidoreductase [Kofleriaceae bacterium]|nr:SDR family NAD(P)-dependent oxidoreductase [Kofleriaceae bacterium]
MRSILVTGANKGIGLAIATEILRQQADTSVWLGSRSAERGRAAIAGLVAETPAWADRLRLLELDVASDESVARARAEVAAAGTLHALVNNAGVGSETKLADVLAVNALGVHRVSEAFVPLLDATRGRVVNITSASGPSFVSRCSPEWQRFFLDRDITWAKLEAFIADCIAMGDDKQAFTARGLDEGEAYGLSKACANSYTMILARTHPSLRVNACTPGFIATDLTRHYAAAAGKSPEEMGMKPPVAGTVAPLFLLFGDPEGNGHFYGSDAKRSPLDRYRSPGSPPYTGD